MVEYLIVFTFKNCNKMSIISEKISRNESDFRELSKSSEFAVSGATSNCYSVGAEIR